MARSRSGRWQGLAQDTPGRWWPYALMMAAAVAAVALTQVAGGGLTAPPGLPPAAPSGSAAATGAGLLFHFLLALAAVMALGRVLGWACAWLRQPPVIGEVLAGIALGPSLLGRVSADAGAYLLPPGLAAPLGLTAQLGVILFMFQVGLETNAAEFRGRGRATLGISHAGIVLPFTLGVLLALWLYPRYGTADVPFTVFSLFVGVTMSITAFPVLARMVRDLGLQRTRVGRLALACAAVDDATAWCLLAMVVGLAQGRSDTLVWTGLGLAAFVAVMFLVAQPLLLKLVAHHTRARMDPRSVALLLLAVMLAALATEIIGIHAIFGAFLLGVLIPHDSHLARDFSAKATTVTSTVLLPAFFAYAGMRTQVGLLRGGEAWLACALIVLVATVGKVGGTWLAARMQGVPKPESAALGILMNTRGLVELIALNIGLDLGILSPALYTLLVLMAVVTTLATVPALRWWAPGVLPEKAEGRV